MFLKIFIKEDMLYPVLKLFPRIIICGILLLSFFHFNSCSHTAARKKARLLVQDIKIGETSQKNIKNLFGNPDYFGTRNFSKNGRPVQYTWWFYSFIAESGYKTLSLYFDDEGKVFDFDFSTHP